MKSVKPKDGSSEPLAQGGGRNPEADFHGQKSANDTHASTTDNDARLYRKGKETQLRYDSAFVCETWLSSSIAC